MSKFAFSPLKLGETWYLPMPKLNGPQVEFLTRRFANKGFDVARSRLLVGRRGEAKVHIDPVGLCWSSTDPSDAVGPAMPGILGMEREEMGFDEVRSLYFSMRRLGRSTIVRFSTRLESSPLWKVLRSTGQCGLTPDELDVVLMVVRSSRNRCTFITDFPTEGCKARLVGERKYYESLLETDEVSSTLRPVGEKRNRNSYLPRGGMLKFEKLRLPPLSEQVDLFGGLGEWCYLRPRARESSNC